MTTQDPIRCYDCQRLLFKMEPDALSGTLTIRCPRCKATNILRPVRALDPERPMSADLKGT